MGVMNDGVGHVVMLLWGQDIIACIYFHTMLVTGISVREM